MKRKTFLSLRQFSVLTLVLTLGLAPSTIAQSRLPRLLSWESTLKGQDQETLRWPVAVAEGPAGELAVADAFRKKIFFFKDSGVSWTQGEAVDLEASPLDIARDGERYVISLRGEALLVALDIPRRQLRHLALPAGVIPGSLASMPGGGVLLQDLATGDILTLSPQGSVWVKVKAVAMDIGDLAATAGGGFVATFPTAGEVRRFDALGTENARWAVPRTGPVPAWPVGVSLAPSGDITIADRHGQRLVSFDNSGRPRGIGSRGGWVAGLLRHPSRLVRLNDGRIAVVDQGNGRLQIFKEAASESGP